MAPVLKTESHKEQVPKGWTYLLGLTHIHDALHPSLTRDAYLSLSFTPRQAYWKEQRELVDQQRRYRVIEVNYSPGREHVPRLPGIVKPWDDEEHPKVVTAQVLAVPHELLPRGVAVRPVLCQLLADSFLKLMPRGLTEDRSPRSAWMLEVVLDGTTSTLEASLSPWNGAEHQVSARLTRQLQTAAE